MIDCVRFADVEIFLQSLGFDRVGETDGHYLYERATSSITVHKPNIHDDVTLIEIELACDHADIAPPKFDTHWCD